MPSPRFLQQIISGLAGRSAVDLGTALNHIDLKVSPRIYYSAVHNLAVALTDCKDFDALRKALQLLKEARKLIRFRGRHVAKFKLQWLQGKIWNRLGCTRQGERCLLRARDGLAEMGAAYEVAFISLDLTELYLLEAEAPGIIAQMARETYELFSGMSSDEKALAALLIWSEAAARETLTDEVIRAARERILSAHAS